MYMTLQTDPTESYLRHTPRQMVNTLGFIPDWFRDWNPRTESFDSLLNRKYAHGGGSSAKFENTKLAINGELMLTYPEDPPQAPFTILALYDRDLYDDHGAFVVDPPPLAVIINYPHAIFAILHDPADVNRHELLTTVPATFYRLD